MHQDSKVSIYVQTHLLYHSLTHTHFTKAYSEITDDLNLAFKIYDVDSYQSSSEIVLKLSSFFFRKLKVEDQKCLGQI